MEFSIRPIVEKDFEALLLLFKEFAAFEKKPDAVSNTLARMKAEQAFFNGYVAITPKNEMVAYTIFFFSYHTWQGKTLYMDDLYVKQPYRGLGLGTRLLDVVVERARKEHCHKCRWQVAHWNHKAIGFYKKIGATLDLINKNCDLQL